MVNGEAEKFIIEALEATIFILPRDTGLTFDELIQLGAAFGKPETRKGTMKDEIDALFSANRIRRDRRGRLHFAGYTPFDLGFFIHETEHDRRNIHAFDFITTFFAEKAHEEGLNAATATRDELVHASTPHSDFSAHDIEVAITCWLLTGVLKEKDGKVSFQSDPRSYPLPSTQREGGTRGRMPRPDTKKIHDLVANVIAARGAAPTAAPTGTTTAGTPQKGAPVMANASKVFLVHGRNMVAREEMAKFLRAIGLQVIEWNEASALTGNPTATILDIIDAGMKAAAVVVVLFTGDDEVCLRAPLRGAHDSAAPVPQARPNVIFEAGYAMGRDPKRVVLVELGQAQTFSDIHGIHTIRITNAVDKRNDLASRLRVAGCTVNTTGNDWQTHGDFDSATK